MTSIGSNPSINPFANAGANIPKSAGKDEFAGLPQNFKDQVGQILGFPGAGGGGQRPPSQGGPGQQLNQIG